MKPIQFDFEGKNISGELHSKIAKKDLYGYAKKVVRSGEVILEKGYITAEGNLLPKKAITLQKCDTYGSPVETVNTLVNGEQKQKLPSTLEEPAKLVNASYQDLVGFNVTDVYPVNIVIEPGIYATQFSYYASILRKDAFLLVKPEQSFLLIGELKSTAWIGEVVIYDFFNNAEEEEDADELDFDMI